MEKGRIRPDVEWASNKMVFMNRYEILASRDESKIRTLHSHILCKSVPHFQFFFGMTTKTTKDRFLRHLRTCTKPDCRVRLKVKETRKKKTECANVLVMFHLRYITPPLAGEIGFQSWMFECVWQVTSLGEWLWKGDVFFYSEDSGR